MSHSLRFLGQRTRRARISPIRIDDANRNRIPANVNGGKSFSPTFMKSHVDPQMPHRISQTMRAFMIYLYQNGQRFVEPSVREADELKVAQHFSAGEETVKQNEARETGDRICRPLRGLVFK